MKASVLRVLLLTSSVSKLFKTFVVPLHSINNGICRLIAHIVNCWTIKHFYLA
jgi:hypothetical protein